MIARVCQALRDLELKFDITGARRSTNVEFRKRTHPGGLRVSVGETLRRASRAHYREPRPGMRSFSQFAARSWPGVSRDADEIDARARWDRYRTRLPKAQRRVTQRANEAHTGDSGYAGEWFNHLRHQTPAVGPRRRKLPGAMPRGGPGKR